MKKLRNICDHFQKSKKMINEDQQLRRAVFLPLYYTVISLMVSSCHTMIIIGLPCHGPGPPLALGSLGDLLRTHPLPIFVPAQWGKKTGYRRFVPVCVIVYLRLIDRLNISIISVLLLTVLFFLPFFQLWVNEKLLLVMGGLYAFLFVPVTVGFVKPNLLEQQSFVSRLKRKLQLRILTNETAHHYMQSFAEFWNSGWLQV